MSGKIPISEIHENNKYYYWLWKNIIPDSVIDIINSENKLEQSSLGTLEGNRSDKDVRYSNVILHGRDYWPTGILLNYGRMANYLANWRYELFDISTIQFAFYDNGQYYDWHCDTFIVDNSPVSRKVTVIIGISKETDYEGGELTLEGMDPIRLDKGDIICFPSLLRHRVSPVKNGIRKSFTGWIEGPAFR